ncbi:MAG: helix-turn-helix domain-containing protein [Polyangiaceae bacterium]
MPLPRFYKLDPEQRENLLGAARAEMLEHGYEGASFNRVIERAGISKGAMYYYFADKADLYRTVTEAIAEEAMAAFGELGPVSTAAEYWGGLEAMMQRALTWITAQPQLAEIGKSVYANQGGVLDALRARLLEGVSDVLKQGQDVGAIRTDFPLGLLAEAATGMMMGADRWFAEHFAEMPAEDVMRISYATYGLLRQLLEPPRAEP